MKLFLLFALVLSGNTGSCLLAQTSLTNEDVPRLVKAGLSDEFILVLIDQQGAKLSSDADRLVELKNGGVSEPVILAIARRSPATEPLTSYGVIQLGKAGFSERFLLSLIEQQTGGIVTDARRLIEMKRAGLSESVISAVVRKSPSFEPLTSDSVARLVEAEFTEGFVLDLLGRSSGRFSTDPRRIIELKQAGVSERILAVMIARGTSRELPPGTEITIRLIDSIDSEKHDEGNEFRASLDDPIRLGDTVIAPKGADARVRLVTEKESGKLTGRTELSVQLVSLAVDGKMVSVSTNSVTQVSGSRGERTAKSAAATGALGAIIGAIAGGGSGAAIGAGAGAAAGAGSQVLMKDQRVRIPSESILTFVTQEATNVPW